MDNIDFQIQIGQKIREARHERKLTVRELGSLCELDYGHISRVENGQMDVRISTIRKIAEVLEYDIRYFF